MRTIKDRIQDHPALRALADLNSKVDLALYLEIKKGRQFAGDLAKTFYQEFGISAKNLEHIHIGLKARMDSEHECAIIHITDLKEKIATKKRDVLRRETQIVEYRAKLTKLSSLIRPDEGKVRKLYNSIRIAKNAIHQHRRRVTTLGHRLQKAQSRANNVRLCYGSRSLLRKRSSLNPDTPEGMTRITHWRQEWNRRRAGEIFIPGNASSPDGNISVRLESNSDGSWNLVLRLPSVLAHIADRQVEAGGVVHNEVIVGNLRFPHGCGAFSAALADQKNGNRAPVTWRIQPHRKGGWLVSCTFREALPEIAMQNYAFGALGVDFNAGHLALCLTNDDGIPIRFWKIPLITHSRSSDQNEDATRKAALKIAKLAKQYHVPIVAEKLDFSKKKAEINSQLGARYARMLNGLVYAGFCIALTSVCQRQGIMLRRVSPAYTSIIGFAKFAKPFGVSIHAAAACAIARRGQSFSERVPDQVRVSLIAGVHGTLPRPEVQHSCGTGIAKIGKGRKPLPARRHVWASWSRIAQGRKAALTAQLRSLQKERSAKSSHKTGLGGCKNRIEEGDGSNPHGQSRNGLTRVGEIKSLRVGYPMECQAPKGISE